ncbi:cupin domain-containing protein [Franzmannia pantelleriensis]|nr:cupin domain-containing protein [Halomonas pantelleriensis]
MRQTLEEEIASGAFLVHAVEQMQGNMMTRPQASSQEQINNDQVIVTRWDFPPGAETGWHRHAHDYVIVPIHDGVMLLETSDGHREVTLQAGVCYNRLEGTEHNVINNSETPFSFVEVELK